MRVHWLSALLGLAALPLGMALLWALWRGKLLNAVRSSTPTNDSRRAAFAARVYSGRKVLVLRFRDAAIAVSLGRSYAEEQRAANALLKEFKPAPPPPLRIRGRTW